MWRIYKIYELLRNIHTEGSKVSVALFSLLWKGWAPGPSPCKEASSVLAVEISVWHRGEPSVRDAEAEQTCPAWGRPQNPPHCQTLRWVYPARLSESWTACRGLPGPRTEAGSWTHVETFRKVQQSKWFHYLNELWQCFHELTRNRNIVYLQYITKTRAHEHKVTTCC